jgi:predicted amidohydrolase
VADPRGEVVALAPDAAPAAIVAQLDLEIVRQQRRQEPVFRALRPELYEL